MTDALTVAAAAIRTAENRVSAAAAQILHAASTPSTAPLPPVEGTLPPSYQTLHPAMPTAELAEGLVDLKRSELAFREGIALAKAADEMTRQTLDILT